MTPATTLRDARHSIRILLKHKGFAGAAILAFALGIGANTAIFSVINSVLLQPLAYKDPGKLVVSQLNGSTTTAPAPLAAATTGENLLITSAMLRWEST